MTLSMGPRPPRLLVVDDEQSILDLLRRRLEALGCEVTVLSGGSQVAVTVREKMPDLVLLDVMMPDVDGFTVCQALKQDPQVRDIPVVLMTARTEVDSRIKGLEMGAHDYVTKPFETAELLARVRAALRVKALQDELREANKLLERLATSDPLTDLPNRRTFDEQIFLAIERSRRTGQTVSVIMLDLDHFKQINDTHGHQVGDEALRQVAHILAGRRRVTDLVARYGFRVRELFVEHIFPYRIPEYVRYEYKRAWYFQAMPRPLFRWLETHLGWHLCVTAVAEAGHGSAAAR